MIHLQIEKLICKTKEENMIQEIIDELIRNTDIKVVSFDIFDTLLFRTVMHPKFIFNRMYDWYTDKFPDFTDAEDWKNSRVTAEITARKKELKISNCSEVTLDKIYKELPTVYTNIEELMQLEIECEKLSCFLNQEIYETLTYIKNKLKLKVILTSDMYLGEKIIRELLITCGVDCFLIDNIFVSVDYSASKRKGGLYEIILNRLNIKNSELYHIGDNYYSDIGVACKLNIPHYFYNLISEAEFKYSYLKMEEWTYNNICQQIYALRLMAASKNNEKDFFFDIGAMIAGPFFTYATEWVLDEAEKNDIHVIRPMMREGKFLTELLDIAKKERTTDFSIEPLYISRFATFTATFEYITEYEIKYLLDTYYLTLHKVFEILNIEDLEGKYSKYLNIETEKFKSVKYGNTNLYEDVLLYLTSEEVLNKIRERNAGSSSKLLDYLKQMKLTEKSITLDVGWRGTMQSVIHNLLLRENIKPEILHLLFISKPETVYNAVDGCDVRGFLGNFGKDRTDIWSLYIRLIEMFFLCTDGTTVGYERNGTQVLPRTMQIKYPEWQINAMRKLQEGIMAFQQEYLKLVKIKPYIKKWARYSNELCCLLERLFSYPTKQEAEKLSNIMFDQNYGVNTFFKILDDKLIEKCKREGNKKFYSKFRSESPEWYSGLNVLVEPTCYYEMQLQMKKQYSLYSLILMTNRAIKTAGDKKIILVGASYGAKVIINFLIAINQFDIIEGIVDNNVDLQGSSLAGININKVEQKFDTNIYFCTVTNRAIRDSLFNQIKNITNGRAKFISYYYEDDNL